MKIGVIGTGNMGGALMDAFCKDAENTMVACNHGTEKLKTVCNRTGAVPMRSAVEVAQNCDLLLLAVKPIVMPEILKEIAPVVTKKQIIVSIAVGLTIQSYLHVLGEEERNGGSSGEGAEAVFPSWRNLRFAGAADECGVGAHRQQPGLCVHVH